MKLSIPRDQLLNPVPPRVFLCNTARKKIGQLPATSVTLNAKWRQYSELSFEIQRTYVDLITGETKVHPLYDKAEAPRNVLLDGYGLFCLQDIDDTSGDGDTKSVTAFSLEYATSNKYLTNFHINTGEIDSKEVLYNEAEFGLDYSTDRDSFYKFASGTFDPYESYYKRNYTDTDSYTYEQIQIANAEEYATLLEKSNEAYGQLAEKLYVKKFANVQFFNDNEGKRGLSLLHLIFENIPEWQIGNVDQSLWHKERQFSETRISVYDFLMNNVSKTFGCTFVWDSLEGKVHCFAEVEDDEIENEASTHFETDVYISKDNLASECHVKYSSDNIKTKLVVTGSDDLDIREVNLGRNEIMDLSFYHTEDWMEQDLFEKYDDYLEEIQEAQTGLDKNGNVSTKYPMSYSDAMQGWVSANNRYNDLMHAVPSDENVLLVGDEFKKLFCVYSPIDTAHTDEIVDTETSNLTTLYYDEQCTMPITNIEDGDWFVVRGFKFIYSSDTGFFNKGDSLIPNSMNALVKKLNQYHVDEDIQGNKNDNILLKLKNSASDIATIRIYDDHNAIASSYNSSYNYYSKNDKGVFSKLKIVDEDDFSSAKNELNGNVYTNNYQIQSVIFRASSGTTGDAKTYSMTDWLNGNLTAKMNGTKGMDLDRYTVSYIGTMGAYFVLAKDEVVVSDNGVLEISQEYLDSCGVNLLKEKHGIYTTLFQTQTEAMFSQEKYQCIIQDEQPEGTYRVGTRWLDSNDPNVTLYEYKAATSTSTAGWYTIVNTETQMPESPTDDDLYNYENYQRYLDNFNKLKAVQVTLAKKERQAMYCLDGYKVDIPIVLSDSSSVPENLDRIIEAHFGQFGETHSYGNQQLVNAPWILYTFMTSYDPFEYGKNTKPYNSVEQYYLKPNQNQEIYTPVVIEDQDVFDEYDGSTNEKTLYVVTSGHTFAVYLKDNIPYVAYANSQGVYQMIMEYIRTQTEMSEFFKEGDLWIRLSPFIKEDEYTDSNFLLTGYESEEERISIAKELMESAAKELKSLCKPSLEFSMTMANILALPEFEPLINQFQLGNFIRVEIRDGYVKRTRLLEVNINFDDLSDFSATFGNLVSVKSEIDRHAELLSQAVTAGKQVAKSGNTWQKTVEKANKLETDIANGLQDMALAIGNASGQAISWDSTGMHFRKYKDGSTTEFEPEEIAIINNSLVATNDSWLTSKAAFGKYTIDGEERWGPIAEYVTADKIEGKTISGGSLEIGGTGGIFRVHKDGSVQILGPKNEEKYAGKALENSYRFQTRLTYDGLTVFTDINHRCRITCHVYDTNKPIGENGIEDQEITNEVIAKGGTFTWNRSLSGSNTTWTPTLVDGKPNIILIKHTDIERNAQFDCVVDFEESKFNTEGGASE